MAALCLSGGVEALPGYVWLDPARKVLHVLERELELTEEPPV
jgi:hypothetical protein